MEFFGDPAFSRCPANDEFELFGSARLLTPALVAG